MNDTKKPDYCPEWFDLDNYKMLSKIDRLKWKWLVDMKAFYFELLDNELLKELEFHKETLEYKLAAAVFSTKSVIECELSIETQPIFSLRELKVLHEEFMESLTEEEQELQFLLPDQDVRLDFQYEINLSYSDEAIIDALKKELVRHRLSRAGDNGKSYSNSYIQNLITDNVIPYIDLLLWQKITKNYLTDAQISHLIFPDEYDIDRVNKIRKTVKVKALELLSPNGRKFI